MVTPLGSHSVTASYTYNTGELLFEGTVPITDSVGRLSALSLSYYRSFSLFGRSANVLAAVPYGFGTFEGKVLETAALDLPLGPLRQPVPPRRQPDRRPGDGAAADAAVAAEDPARREPQGDPAHRPVRPDEADQPRLQPLDVQAGARPSRGAGATGSSTPTARSGSSPRTPSSSRTTQLPHGRAVADPGPDRGGRDPRQLRRAAALVGVARRQFLVRRADEPERHREPEDAAEELPRRASRPRFPSRGAGR